MYDAILTLRTDTPTDGIPVTRIFSIEALPARTRAIALWAARSVLLPKSIAAQGYYVYRVSVQVRK